MNAVGVGEKVVDGGRSVMLAGVRRAEFDTVVLDDEGVPYLVRTMVSAWQLEGCAAEAAKRASADGDSPLLAARDAAGVTDLETKPIEPDERLLDLAGLALARNSEE